MNTAVMRVLMRLAIVTGLCAALLAGCQSGSLSNSQQTCESSGGLFSDGKVSCTGSVGTVRGQQGLSIAETDGDLSSQYRLEASMEVGEGTVRARVASAGGGQTGGKVSPGNPLRIDTVVTLDEDDEEVITNLKVSGKKASDLSYEATLVPRN